jgi:hypothetical protein
MEARKTAPFVCFIIDLFYNKEEIPLFAGTVE